jgi:hypothetical protein
MFVSVGSAAVLIFQIEAGELRADEFLFDY